MAVVKQFVGLEPLTVIKSLTTWTLLYGHQKARQGQRKPPHKGLSSMIDRMNLSFYLGFLHLRAFLPPSSNVICSSRHGVIHVLHFVVNMTQPRNPKHETQTHQDQVCSLTQNDVTLKREAFAASSGI
jgi:hypothetical protein